MNRQLCAGLAALSLAGALALPSTSRATEVSMRETGSASRIVLDLRKRQISVLRDGRRLGPWPVAIGDPKTPTPVGEFEILTKK